MTEQKGAGNGKREEKEGNDCGNGLNDILVPFMVYYLVADIGMPVVIADSFTKPGMGKRRGQRCCTMERSAQWRTCYRTFIGRI